MKGLLNGAPLPNWVKLVVLGAVVGIAIGVNQSAVSTIAKGQEQLRAEVVALRFDMKEAMIFRDDVLRVRLDSLERRIESLERAR